MEFVSPPPSSKDKRSQRWRDVVDELKQHRGEWAFIGEYSPGVAAQIRNGDYLAFIDPVDPSSPAIQMVTHWEVTTRKVDGMTEGKRSNLYIRWLG